MGMRLSIGELTYEVSFRRATRTEGEHDRGDLALLILTHIKRPDPQIKRATVCVISQIVSKQKLSGLATEKTILGIGVSFCYAGDVFLKEDGRRKALGRALAVNPIVFDRNTRRSIWSAYLHRDILPVYKKGWLSHDTGMHEERTP